MEVLHYAAGTSNAHAAVKLTAAQLDTAMAGIASEYAVKANLQHLPFNARRYLSVLWGHWMRMLLAS